MAVSCGKVKSLCEKVSVKVSGKPTTVVHSTLVTMVQHLFQEVSIIQVKDLTKLTLLLRKSTTGEVPVSGCEIVVKTVQFVLELKTRYFLQKFRLFFCCFFFLRKFAWKLLER